MWSVGVDGEETSAIFQRASTPAPRAVFVFAHGAGGHMEHPTVSRVAALLLARGIDVVRFNFLYRERGSRRPDAMPGLKACTAAVVKRTRAELNPGTLLIGGRSMGGRVASMLAADGIACDGLILFAYPLHPAGSPEKLRDAHLPHITAPVLCFNGTRDALCRRDLMERVLDVVPAPWNMHWLDGADHSFHVLKSSGRTDEEVLEEVGEASECWLSALPRKSG
jgi:predicted alpha/beta-hydrolase family hydrolase